MLFFISWPLTLMTMALGALMGLSIGFLQRLLAKRGKEVSDNNQQVLTCLQDTFTGIRVVRATNSQERETGRFHAANQQQAETEERVAKHNALMSPLAETVAVSGAMLIVGLAYGSLSARARCCRRTWPASVSFSCVCCPW